MEFVIIEGPHESTHEADPLFVEKGFKAPRNEWVKLIFNGKSHTNYYTEKNAIVHGLEESFKVIHDTLDEQGPFDGVIAFS
jgi:hypothetical protein